MSRSSLPIAFAGLALCIATITTVATSHNQQPASPVTAPDVTKLGPQVGEKVPDFTLPDQNGRNRTLASLSGSKGLVLVFNRSADW
jgi:cytochrome oxidase Cu insertion factor (SCO1/SenC/PrrC family)